MSLVDLLVSVRTEGQVTDSVTTTSLQFVVLKAYGSGEAERACKSINYSILAANWTSVLRAESQHYARKTKG